MGPPLRVATHKAALLYRVLTAAPQSAESSLGGAVVAVLAGALAVNRLMAVVPALYRPGWVAPAATRTRLKRDRLNDEGRRCRRRI